MNTSTGQIFQAPTDADMLEQLENLEKRCKDEITGHEEEGRFVRLDMMPDFNCPKCDGKGYYEINMGKIWKKKQLCQCVRK